MNIPENLAKAFGQTKSDNIGQAVEELVTQAVTQRRRHERRWYDNNFFDDGYHFRTISRKTGRVIDTINKATGYIERAIPRASLQIRGVSNLLYSAEPYPVVYPKRVSMTEFTDTDGQINSEGYKGEIEKSKQVARKQGIWLTTEWEDEDLGIKLIDMMLLAAKNSVSYLKIYSDPENQQICTEVKDAFDIILYGDRRDLKSLPFITEACPMELKEVLVNPLFDPKMVAKLQPDNKYATSEIKDAYMRSRFGNKTGDQSQSTIIVKDTFMQEYLSEENWKRVVKMSENKSGLMDGKSKGDTVMRHVFSAGGVTLSDGYEDYDEYPYADFRFEPGPLYQVPFIERFIPQNKSLDIIVTRLEKWVNSMIVGVYQKRKGENYQVSNFPGGQMLEYETTPLSQMTNATVGGTPFQVIQLLDKYIEEQGASTSALSQLPNGVKGHQAIESLKSSEYANLKIATKMLNKTVKTIAERMLERGDKDYIEPKEVEYLNDSEPDYFDVIGQRGMELSQKVNKQLPPDVIPISRKTKIRIEIEPGLGLTMNGKRDAMQQIITFMIQLQPLGAVNGDALKQVIKRFLETYGYGSTQEFMEALDEGATQGELDEESITKMKIAIAEVLKDMEVVGPKAEDKMVDSTKIGVLEAMKDAGMLNKQENPKQPEPNKVSINYKDLPTEGKVQAAGHAGIEIAPESVQTEEAKQHVLKQTLKTPTPTK